MTDDAFLDARGESMGFEDADRFPSEQFAPTALVGCACRILIDGLLEPSVPVRPPSTDGLVDAQIKPRFVSTSHESLRRIAASAINAMQDMTAEDGVACGTASLTFTASRCEQVCVGHDAARRPLACARGRQGALSLGPN